MSEEPGNYSTKAKTIFRIEKNKDNPYVMIDRRLIENPSLSWKAKGLLAYLLSRPDNWTVRFQDLVKRSPDGGHTVRAAMKELKQAGHVKVVAEREQGRIKQWIYTVYELPDCVFQQVEKQDVENRTLNDTDSNNIPVTSEKPKKDLVDGYIELTFKPKAIRDAFAKYFQLTPNWDAKYNRQFLEWMVEMKVTPEQVKGAANIWKYDKRFNWKAPDLRGVQEHWLELTQGAPEIYSGGGKSHAL
jgi:hypothetical protein